MNMTVLWNAKLKKCHINADLASQQTYKKHNSVIKI